MHVTKPRSQTLSFSPDYSYMKYRGIFCDFYDRFYSNALFVSRSSSINFLLDSMLLLLVLEATPTFEYLNYMLSLVSI